MYLKHPKYNTIYNTEYVKQFSTEILFFQYIDCPDSVVPPTRIAFYDVWILFI